MANYVLPLITFPYLARILHPDNFGLVAYSQAFIQYFATITEYGFQFSATREIAIHRNDPARLSRIFSSVMAAKLLLMTASFAAMSALVFAIPMLRGEWLLYYAGFLTVLGSFLFPVWVFIGLEKMQYIAIREVAARVFTLIPIFLFVHHPSDYLKAAAIQSGSMAAAGLAGLIAVPRATPIRFVRVSWRDIQNELREGWQYFLSNAAITFCTSGNVVILGAIGSRESVGYYAVGKRIVDAARLLVSPIETAMFPHVSRLASESRSRAVAFIRKNYLRVSLPFAVLSLALLAGAPLILSVAGGKRFASPEAILSLRLMAPIPFLAALAYSYSTCFMLAFGYKKQWSRMLLLAGVLNFAVLGILLTMTSPINAVAITGTLVAAFVLIRSYLFFSARQA